MNSDDFLMVREREREKKVLTPERMSERGKRERDRGKRERVFLFVL